MRKIDDNKLIVATHNRGKLHEIAALIEPFGFSTQSAGQLGLAEPVETGTTFEENAYIKAFAAAQATGLAALSDDSGLVVDALDGAPGVYTADWATKPDGSRDFALAMQKVETALQQAGASTQAARTGRFVSLICVAWPDGDKAYFRGEVEGQIVWPPRGELGFGFDPIFQPKGYDKTFGEMTTSQKHGWKPGDCSPLSHRARAFKLFAEAMLENHVS